MYDDNSITIEGKQNISCDDGLINRDAHVTIFSL